MSFLFRRAASSTEKTPCSLGIDIGCSASKEALAWQNAGSGQARVLRVHHTEREDDPIVTNTAHEFVAYAAFEEGNPRPIVGRQALKRNNRVPVKVVLDHFAGITGLEDLPQAREFLKWISNGEITREQEAEVLQQHFKLLATSASTTAEAKGLKISQVILTYPNFLGPHERDGDFEKLSSCCLELVHLVFSGVPVAMVSEAQCAALYTFEEYDDALSAINRRALWSHFGGLRGEHGLNVLQVDAGSSTFNFQTMYIYFDAAAQMAKNMWLDDPAWAPGTTGGSHLLNSTVHEMIMPQLRDLSADIAEGEVATIMQDFETKKRSYNFTLQAKGLKLQGTEPWILVRLTAHELHDAFMKAFGKGLRVLQEQVHSLINERKDFVVIFSGGSFRNGSLWDNVKKSMEEMKEGAQRKDVELKYGRLTDFDRDFWSSAGAIGAALSMSRKPHPIQLLEGSAIGIQVQKKTSAAGSGAVWKGTACAQVILSTGHREYVSAILDIPSSSRDKTRLMFVCVPAFDHESSDGLIDLQPHRQEARGSEAAYDLGWVVTHVDLPKILGPFTFSFSGEDWAVLTDPAGPDPDLYEHFCDRPIRLTLNCHACDADGNRRQSTPDRTWQLRITTDPGSKLLSIDEIFPERAYQAFGEEVADQSLTCGQREEHIIRPTYTEDHRDDLNAQNAPEPMVLDVNIDRTSAVNRIGNGFRWTAHDNRRLLALKTEGRSDEEIATEMQRSASAVHQRWNILRRGHI